MSAETPSPYCQQVGLRVDLCLLAQVTSTQDLLQASCAATWQNRQGQNDRQFSATTSKASLASDKDLSIQPQDCMIVFAVATHILKLERSRKDQHGPCAKMTRKFVKRCKFSTVSSDHASGNGLAILPVGKALRRSLFAASSYIEPRTAASIAPCGLVAGRRNK